MNDNALLQRQLYKYETTMSELDVVIRSEHKDQAIFELKKMVESQLKQIVALQKEIEAARSGMYMHSQPTAQTTSITPQQPDDITMQEIDNLRRELAELRASNGAANAQIPDLRQANENLD